MAPTQLTVETIPALVSVEERDGSRRLDFSFAIHNPGDVETELVAVEQDVYNVSGALIQLRLVDENGAPIAAAGERGSRIGPGERRTIRNPLPEFAPGTPLETLVYRFVFRTGDGHVLQSTIRFSPIERRTPPPEPSAGSEQLLPQQRTPTPTAADRRPSRPTPRQLARSWFETLYELGVYATA